MEERNAVTLSSPLSPQTNPVPCRRGWDSGPPGWTETRPRGLSEGPEQQGFRSPPALSLSLSLGGDWKWVAFIAHPEYRCLNGVAVLQLDWPQMHLQIHVGHQMHVRWNLHHFFLFKRTWNYNEPFLRKHLWFDFAQFSAFIHENAVAFTPPIQLV